VTDRSLGRATSVSRSRRPDGLTRPDQGG
jgi:hypothetical protein